jgi:hypothetical protein
MKLLLTTDNLPLFFSRARRILILELGVVSLRLVQSAVEKHAANVTTKGGLGLPAEIWDMVFQFGAASPHSSNLELVKATGLPQHTLTGHVIRFKAVRLTQVKPYEKFNGEVDISRSLEFIGCPEAEMPTIEKSGSFTLEWDVDRELPTYAVTIPKEHDGGVSAPRVQPLYHTIRLVDVIAKVQDGHCGKCSNTRFICSCLGRPTSSRECCDPLFTYNGRVVAYCMAIPCPVCLGRDLFAIWQIILSGRFKTKPSESAEYLSRILLERLEELRYPSSLGKSPKQIMAERERALQHYAAWKKMEQ